MPDAARAAHIDKIAAAKEELKTAGPIHSKDLRRYIKRLERELREYDRFHEGGGGNGERTEPPSSKHGGSTGARP